MDFMIREVKTGKGVFAGRLFSEGDKIFDFSGRIYSRAELPKDIISPEDDRFLQIDKDAFLGPSGEIDDLINHSCEPNSALLIEGRQASLFAIKNIEEGEEINYDYSIQMYDEPWTMKCNCGSKSCRQIVKEYKYLPQGLKNYYLKLGFVPDYNRGR